MRLGNEQANTSSGRHVSLRVFDGHSADPHLGRANLGFRMLFGFETVSADDPDYGRLVWDEWNRGKSFSTAWLRRKVAPCLAHGAPAGRSDGLRYRSPLLRALFRTRTGDPLLTMEGSLARVLVSRVPETEVESRETLLEHPQLSIGENQQLYPCGTPPI